MASNPYVNKVVYGGTTLIDLTSDTVDAASLFAGVTAHGADGAVVTGTVADGDPLGYGRSTNALAGAAIAGSAVVQDTDTDAVGRAMSDMARLVA